jgi:hypothetical protein
VPTLTTSKELPKLVRHLVVWDLKALLTWMFNEDTSLLRLCWGLLESSQYSMDLPMHPGCVLEVPFWAPTG